MGTVERNGLCSESGTVTGHELMEAALSLRDSANSEAAARWLESNGINYELAILALIGKRGSLLPERIKR